MTVWRRIGVCWFYLRHRERGCSALAALYLARVDAGNLR